MSKDLLPFATTMQFRRAVKCILGDRVLGRGYTDKNTAGDRKHVMMYTSDLSDQDLKNIEFMLWCQGVTAVTRKGHCCVRGTCAV